MIPQLHFHGIPRYRFATKDPRGTVRWVIPEMGKYWRQEGRTEITRSRFLFTSVGMFAWLIFAHPEVIHLFPISCRVGFYITSPECG